MKSSATQNSQSWGWEWRGEFCHTWLHGLECCHLIPWVVHSLQRQAQSSVDLLSKYFLHSWMVCFLQWCAQALLLIVDFCSVLRGLKNALRFQTKWRFTLCLILLSPVPLGVATSWEMPAAPNKNGKPLKAEIRLKAAGWFFLIVIAIKILKSISWAVTWAALPSLCHELSLFHHPNLLKLQGNKHFSRSLSTLCS